jgi:3-deoxy-D-manno-octulosonic-acid transferase
MTGLRDLEDRCIYAGLSPRDPEWIDLFRSFQVKKVLISKYDFWPGLLKAAADLDIVVCVINAEPRSSLRWVRFLFNLLRERLPRFCFFSNSVEGGGQLRALFPNDRVVSGVDPRWERVARRIEHSRSGASLKWDRVHHWSDQWKGLPRPWVLVGSAWIGDLKVMIPAFQRSPGTLIVVPHSLEPANLATIRDALKKGVPERHVLVDEMGLLVELYSHSDRVMVGGGFDAGIHSTLEPAISGQPICCGPRRVDDFKEAVDLRRLGVLTVCTDPDGVNSWLRSPSLTGLNPLEIAKHRQEYRSLLEECLRIR